MASSKKLPKNNLSQERAISIQSELKLFIRQFFRSQQLTKPTLIVAYSGGLDSTVLLHQLQHLQLELPFHLKAVHINHGLSENADAWAAHCENYCHQLNVPIEVISVLVKTTSGLGIEAAARHARYDALDALSADAICLGHHQDDQAETFLLQLARGAGVKGLAGMSQVDVKRRLIRPLLHFKRADLHDYAIQHQLKWIDDESNDDVKFDRNFMRHQLIPVFSKRYADITKVLARSAMHMGDACVLLDDLAELDAAEVIDDGFQFGAIKLRFFSNLNQSRQGNLIRWWLSKNQMTMPSAALLNQILSQLKSDKPDAAIKVKVSKQLAIMRYQNIAYLIPETKKSENINLLWQGEDSLTLPDSSCLYFTKKMGEGFAYRRGGSTIKLRIKNRQGGEYFKPALGRPRRRLKTIMQSSEIPPWEREQLPLIFMDETLVIIPNIGVNAEMKAESHEEGLIVTWVPYR